MTSDEMDIIGTNDGAGLGGDRDTTNVFESSNLAASVITTIGEERMAALGGSLETIAEAKAGITKHGRPVGLGGPFLAHIKDIIYSKAASLSSPVHWVWTSGSSIKGITNKDGIGLCQSCDIVIQSEKDDKPIVELCDVNLRMLGNHQLQNDVLPHVYLRDQGMLHFSSQILAMCIEVIHYIFHSLKKLLHNKAEAFLSNDYYESHLEWMD
uniref:Uncharacterized protein n=1 Tax=Brassica campestris TaxID=3711 RepID=A0A3P5ZP37_BRACM|nr:unnamed protein product [Brassica rapa]